MPQKVVMMIAFVAVKSSLVPFIEGLCSSNPCRFDFLVLSSHFFAFLFWKETYVQKTVECSHFKISSRRPAYIYTCVLRTHIRINVSWDLVHLDSPRFFRLSKCPGPTSEYPTCSECVFTCTHTQTHIHFNPRPKSRKYRQHLYLPHVKNDAPRQQQVPCID